MSAAAAAAASLVVAAAVVIAPGPAFADEEQLPGPLFPGYNDPQKAKLKAAEENFQQSDTLKKVKYSVCVVVTAAFMFDT